MSTVSSFKKYVARRGEDLIRSFASDRWLQSSGNVNAFGGFPAGLTMLGTNGCIDAATNPPAGFKTHEAGVHRLNEIIQNAVGDIFVKVSFIAVAPHVELQGLKLEILFVGNVVKYERGEVRLPGQRTKAGELEEFPCE